MIAPRRRTREVKAGRVIIGGEGPVSVQSMVKRDPHDGPAVLAQVEELAAAGCEICRLAVPDAGAADVFGWVAGRTSLPLVADIHFDYRLALMAIDAGAAKLRVNPGNLGGPDALRAVAGAAAAAGVPIRVGVNLGSLEHDIASDFGYTGAAMAESAIRQVRLLEDTGFQGIVISAKAPDVPRTVEAYRLIASRTDWPLHLGVTEAGPGTSGLVKSSAGLGILLAEGIGDTIRVSLSEDALDEVTAGYAILESLGLRRVGPELVSCPTCGRSEMDVIGMAHEVERRLAAVRQPMTVAVMGCAVNGPGEARRADVGIAGTAGGQAVLFVHGRVVRSFPAGRAVDELFSEINRILEGDGGEGRSG